MIFSPAQRASLPSANSASPCVPRLPSGEDVLGTSCVGAQGSGGILPLDSLLFMAASQIGADVGTHERQWNYLAAASRWEVSLACQSNLNKLDEARRAVIVRAWSLNHAD